MKNEAEAKTIASRLVKDKLIACANIVKGVQSIFRWQGRVDQAAETLLILKSKKSKFPRIVKTVKLLHSYAVPEIIALPIVEGSPSYLDWIDRSLK